MSLIDSSFTETSTINTCDTKFRTHLVLTNLSPKNKLRTNIILKKPPTLFFFFFYLGFYSFAHKFTVTHCHSKETSCSVIPLHNITHWFVFFIFYLFWVLFVLQLLSMCNSHIFNLILMLCVLFESVTKS